MRERWILTSMFAAMLLLGAVGTLLLNWTSAFPLTQLATCIFVPASLEPEFRSFPRPPYWPELVARLFLVVLALAMLSGDLRARGAIAATVVTTVILGKTVIVRLRQ